MTNEPLTLSAAVSILLMVVCGLGGAVWYSLNQRLMRLEETARSLASMVHDHAVLVARNYPTKQELADFGDRIIAGMNQIRASLMDRRQN